MKKIIFVGLLLSLLTGCYTHCPSCYCPIVLPPVCDNTPKQEFITTFEYPENIRLFSDALLVDHMIIPDYNTELLEMEITNENATSIVICVESKFWNVELGDLFRVSVPEGYYFQNDDTYGDIASLKYSAESVSGDTPTQIATTGYCWDASKPMSLIESRNGKTLSATAGTAFSPASVGNNYECTAFDSTYSCDHASGRMSGETMELRSKCTNITSTSEVKVTFYEDGTAETTNALTLGAGATNSYQKWMLEVNTSNKGFALKAICFGTNDTSSNIASLDVKNWNKDSIPESLTGTADDWCFSKPTATVLNEWDSKTFEDAIVVKADSTGAVGEVVTMTLYDECEYVADDGSIKKDYFERGTDAENDCGATNPTTSFTVG